MSCLQSLWHYFEGPGNISSCIMSRFSDWDQCLQFGLNEFDYFTLFLILLCFMLLLFLLSVNPTKWSNTFKQFVGKLPTNYLSVFHHFMILALKELTNVRIHQLTISIITIHRRTKVPGKIWDGLLWQL